MSVNIHFISGHVGQDITLRSSGSGDSIANFSVATTEKVRGEEITEWHKCVAFGKLAEYLAEYHGKGSQLTLHGNVRTNSWTDKEGRERKDKEIKVNFVDSIKPKGKGDRLKDSEVPF